MKKPAHAITGEIVSFNVSPKGFHESFMLMHDKRLVQINLPKHSATDASSLKIGQNLTVQTRPFDDEELSDHPVYEWIQDGTTCNGTIKQINYSLHGEPNGAILDTGEFVHLRPRGAKVAKLKIGHELSVEGDIRKSPAGQTVIEARKVNGKMID